MKIKIILSIFFFVILFLSGCTVQEEGKDSLTVITQNGDVRVYVEVADTVEERQEGLMYREKLAKNSGMLFIFENERILSFWMKNTQIPLDMIFISANGTITEIKHYVQPCLTDPCPTYPSEYPNKYVLEVNAGFSEENDIQVGDRLDLLELGV